MVLVVDDFLDTCLILQHMLEREGVPTQCAMTAAQAESVLKTVTPRVILLDYMMPDRSGLELLQELRNDTRLAHIPVLMFSARSDEKLVEHAKHLGAQWVVKGQVDWIELVHEITELHG